MTSFSTLPMPQQHASVGVRGSEPDRQRPAVPLESSAVFRASREAMVVVEEDRRVALANPAACALFGASGDALVGRAIEELIAPEQREALTASWPAAAPAQTPYELARADDSRVRIEFAASDELADGRRLWIIRPLDDGRGAPREERRPRFDAQSVGGFGSWEWDLETDSVVWSEQAHRILGAGQAALASWDQALELVHPDDRAGMRAVLDAARTTPRRFSHEYRVMRPDGGFRVIESHAEVLGEDPARPRRLLGTVQDITDRRQAEIERRNLAAVLDNSDDAITTCSLDGRFLTWNRGAEQLYGYTAQEAIGQPLDLIIPDGQRATDHLNWERLLNDEPVRSLETVRQTKDGRTVVVSVTRSLIVDAVRGVVGVASVGRDITALKEAQTLLAAAHADAVAASNMKSQFLANMSHEIRTPMNGVIGMIELLLDTPLTQEQREYAEQVARSGEDMMRIISDILDVSKIEAGQLELDVCEFDVRETIEQACAVPALEARTKGLAFRIEVADEVPLRACGDDRRLRQVLLNLVSNAVKFTAEGSVTVRASMVSQWTGGTRLRIEIADSGIGIDPEKLDRMFEPFTQADPSTTRRYGGTGLGLAIARELMALMGGTIGASSEPGEGSTFALELDLGAAQPAQLAI